MSAMDSTSQNHFEKLPIELRLMIYEFAFPTCLDITIAAVDISARDEERHAFSPRTIEDVLERHQPVLRTIHDRSLLSIFTGSGSAMRSFLKYSRGDGSLSLDSRSTYTSLLTLNHRIGSEIRTFLPAHKMFNHRLYIQYPLGVYVLHDQVPWLLRQARSVHISGIYLKGGEAATDNLFNKSLRRHLRAQAWHSENARLHTAALFKSLVKTFCAAPALANIEFIEIKMSYPDLSVTKFDKALDDPIRIAQRLVPIKGPERFSLGVRYMSTANNGMRGFLRASRLNYVESCWPGNHPWATASRFTGRGDAAHLEQWIAEPSVVEKEGSAED